MLTTNDIATLTETLPSYDRSNAAERAAFIAAFDAWLVATGRVYFSDDSDLSRHMARQEAFEPTIVRPCDRMQYADTIIASIGMAHEDIGTVAR